MTTILVVDDEPLIVEALEAALLDAGFRVSTAANGRQGLERLAEMPRPDVVLLDMMMPVMTGPAMLQAMVGNPELDGIPVIVLSSLPEDAVRARTKKVAAILRKPSRIDEVLSAIHRVLGGAGEGR